MSSNLTIIDKIELPKLIASYEMNFYKIFQFGLSKSVIIKKGYVPIMKRNNNIKIFMDNEINNSSSADYFCFNNTNNQLRKLSEINFNSSYNKVAINFLFYDTIQNITSLNFTLNHVYNLFGSFTVNIFSKYGGNMLLPARRYINIQRAIKYPFQAIQINQFNLNCSLNELILDCVLRVNLSNYANSFQKITIDYGDGSFNSFRINSYCKNSDIYIYDKLITLS